MEIEEVPAEPDLPGPPVYVAVGKAVSSMDAVRWALHNEVEPSGVVFLVHVFPEVRMIPTPLGHLPRNRATSQQLQSHMTQVRSKRSELLQKFIKECNSSKVVVDTILIESDQIAQAIIELIPVMGIRKLIIGASKSSLRKLKKGSGGKEGQILKQAVETCEVKIICNGIQVSPTNPATPSASSKLKWSFSPELPSTPSPTTPRTRQNDNNKSGKSGDNETCTTAKCGCF